MKTETTEETQVSEETENVEESVKAETTKEAQVSEETETVEERVKAETTEGVQVIEETETVEEPVKTETTEEAQVSEEFKSVEELLKTRTTKETNVSEETETVEEPMKTETTEEAQVSKETETVEEPVKTATTEMAQISADTEYVEDMVNIDLTDKDSVVVEEKVKTEVSDVVAVYVGTTYVKEQVKKDENQDASTNTVKNETLKSVKAEDDQVSEETGEEIIKLGTTEDATVKKDTEAVEITEKIQSTKEAPVPEDENSNMTRETDDTVSSFATTTTKQSETITNPKLDGKDEDFGNQVKITVSSLEEQKAVTLTSVSEIDPTPKELETENAENKENPDQVNENTDIVKVDIADKKSDTVKGRASPFVNYEFNKVIDDTQTDDASLKLSTLSDVTSKELNTYEETLLSSRSNDPSDDTTEDTYTDTFESYSEKLTTATNATEDADPQKTDTFSLRASVLTSEQVKSNLKNSSISDFEDLPLE